MKPGTPLHDIQGSPALLEVKGLTTCFSTRSGVIKAVDGASFSIRRGEIVALVGESGCGKSVTSLSIVRLIPSPPGKITAGEVLWKGQDLLEMDDEEMRRIRGGGIAMIFQEPMTSLNPVLTTGRQIMEALQAHRTLDKGEAHRECCRLMSAVGLADPESMMRRYPHQFSGGMRQRVTIAMALSCNPDLLIADEPTTALDVTIQAQILELVARLGRESGMAVILITHNLGIVARYAQRIHVMYAGRLVEQGPSMDLYANPRHPYTAALLRSVPRLDQERRAELAVIAGEPPNMSRLPKGCAFSPRCVRAGDDCRVAAPPLLSVKDGYFVACWRPLSME